jgi:2-succinyl-5-enolpyruvyl-6-hydroxy-3-cyclohexene-1-carboxylate synthase
VNLIRAARLLARLADAGVGELCLCPGGRNSPLVLAAERARGFVLRSFFEERSAAFFAVGRTRATGAPVAVVTTSGTAAAELLPAAVEAHYSGDPLVLVTADRPRAYRGTGAPQAIAQVGLFGMYAPTVFDGEQAEDELDLAAWDAESPVHVNVCFDEPLVDGPVPETQVVVRARPRATRGSDTGPLVEFLARVRSPLVLVGPLDAADREQVADFLLRYAAPVYAEPASGLREERELADLLLTSGEGTLAGGGADVDGVLRIGGVPTVRLWRDLEARLAHISVCSVARTPFPGLTRSALVRGRPGPILRSVAAPIVNRAATRALIARDWQREERLARLWEQYPRAEPSLVRKVSALVPAAALVYLGNSLPIREWDLAAHRRSRRWVVGANRGANGIDGQLSTFLGMCGPGRENWAIVGDLTTLYDLSAPWVVPGLEAGPIRFVVVNNGGGQIFARLSPHAALRNEHGRDFSGWAALWGLAYHRWETVPAAAPPEPRAVIELVPDREQTARFWRAYDALDERP